ncbi:ABC transporter substrate-binding protein [Bradyrhizobium sp. SZCCHNS2022]|uniref:ABC transporter substrate-binding protein n=2 Tax=Bradyrhizobium TaxID=374 RepID=UPI0028E35036|nr:ABC transporter substrate-binding protein [Bradyrhizobium sp. SZCCHNS2022]
MQIARRTLLGGMAASALTGSLAGRAAAADDILIGVPTAQSSPVGVGDQKDWLNGVTLAIDEINAAGGVAGRKLRAEVTDIDIMTPEGTVSAMQTLTGKRVHAIASAFVLIPQPAMDAAAASGTPYLHGNTSIASLELVKSNPAKYKNIFQIDPAETWYGYGFVRYLKQLTAAGWKPKNNNIHIVQEQISYTQVISKSVQKAIAESGGEWVLGPVTDIQFPVQDWSPVLRALHDSDAGVMFIDHWVAAELAAFAQQFAADPVKGSLVYLQYGPSQPEFLKLAAGSAEGMIWGTVIGTHADGKGKDFRSKYIKRYGDNMGIVYTGSGYDTVKLLATVWEKTDPSNFDTVGSAIRKLRYEGVCGTYTFDNAEQAPPCHPWQTEDVKAGISHLLLQVQDGQHKIIAPAELAEVKIKPAPWF